MFKQGLDLLRTQQDRFNIPGLGASIDVLERLVASGADADALQGVIERLSPMARVAIALRGHPSARSELERIAREIEAKFDNVRELQARRSFAAFGDALGAPNLKAYLVGTDKLEGVMEIPAWPTDYPDHLTEDVLVDGRVVETLGLVETCRLAELKYDGNDETLVPYTQVLAKSGLRWMRFQDGRRNHTLTPSACRAVFKPREVGINAMEAIARYVQDEYVLWKHYMDCIGSVRADGRGLCAVLGVWSVGPKLCWRWVDLGLPLFGTASAGSVGA